MQKKKIIMIGPVYPYKGGIAHYTSLMFRQLSKHHDVTMLSYSLQYPKILYPGGEQKDYKNDTFKIENVHFILNTINPLSYIRTAQFVNKATPDAVIIQWWHPFFAPAYYIISKLIKRKTKILFICHNVLPHEKFPFGRILSKITLKNGNCFIVQSETDEKHLKEIIQHPKYRKTVHPTYNAFKQKNLSRKSARNLIDIKDNEQILLFFGFVRKYKGLKYILEAMPQITKELPHCKLLIVGDFWEEDKKECLEQIANEKIENSVRIYDGYIPDNEVEKFFAASDLVVLPYESATQSGIIQIAYSFNIPVIATRVGGLPEVVTEEQTGYLVPPKDSISLGKKIIEFFKEEKAADFQSHIKGEAYRFSWNRMEEIILYLLN